MGDSELHPHFERVPRSSPITVQEERPQSQEMAHLHHHQNAPPASDSSYHSEKKDIDEIPAAPGDWSVSLFSCTKDVKTCCMGLFCPLCLASRLAKDLDEHFLVPCCVPFWLSSYRLKLRMMHGIQGSMFKDCLALCFPSCALCQIANEIRIRQNAGHMKKLEDDTFLGVQRIERV